MTDTTPGKDEIRQLLREVDEGADGAMDRLITAIYPELKRLAHHQLSSERAGHMLNTTAVVHEAFLRLASGKGGWADHGHFLRAAARVMRHLLVDYARQRNAEKRGSGAREHTLREERVAGADDSQAVLAADHALKDIARIDPRLEQIVECRYFAGLSVEETAEALGLSERTVERDSRRARVYLRQALDVDGID